MHTSSYQQQHPVRLLVNSKRILRAFTSVHAPLNVHVGAESLEHRPMECTANDRVSSAVEDQLPWTYVRRSAEYKHVEEEKRYRSFSSGFSYACALKTEQNSDKHHTDSE